uniref:cytochrome c(L), periplasmic n=1 Tax=Castellaniella defragrans TaxID=75697 RepID=UPI003340F802
MVKKLVSKILLISGCILAAAAGPAVAQLVFLNVVTGETLDITQGRPDGRDTPAVKSFMQTGINPYNEDPDVLVKGEVLFATACSACHGHVGEGKIGPAINSGRWDYPQLEEDKGLFETVFGGAARQMGPQYEMLTQDEILQVMAWVRHLYTGDPADATWLTESQRAAFKPYQH